MWVLTLVCLRGIENWQFINANRRKKNKNTIYDVSKVSKVNRYFKFYALPFYNVELLMFLISFKNLITLDLLVKRRKEFNLKSIALVYKSFSTKPVLQSRLVLSFNFKKFNLSKLFNFKRSEKFSLSIKLRNFRKYYKVNFLGKNGVKNNKTTLYKNFSTKSPITIVLK